MPKDTFENLADDKKKRIVEAAKRAFSETHYKKVTIDVIVNYAQIPKGSFYQYFFNKDDLFKYVFHNIGLAKNDELIDEVKKSSDLSFSDLIMQILARAREFEAQDEVMIKLKHRFLKECPQEIKEEILYDVLPKSMALFEDVLNFYVEKGEFRGGFNIKTAAFIITATILNFDKYVLEQNETYEEVVKNVFNILERGLIDNQLKS